MFKTDTMGDRLSLAIKRSPLTLTAIAKEANLSTQAIHQAIKKSRMTPANIERIADVCGEDVDWIKSGIVTMVGGIDPALLAKCLSVMEKASKEMGWDLGHTKIMHAALTFMKEAEK